MSVDTLRQRKQASGTATGTSAVKQVAAAGKTVSTSTSGTVEYADLPSTFTPPSFTVKDLLGAIPKECYERSAIKSSAYLLGDLLMLATFAYLASHIDGAFAYTNGSVLSGVPGRLVRIALWAVYAFCAGSVGTGVWVIAHECGHQAYSPSKTINNTVGWIFHSLLLVPYHSWRISHARHHAATGSMERDEVFVPKTRSQAGLKPAHEVVASSDSDSVAQSTYEAVDDLLEDAPLWNLIQLLVQQTLGWPMYLFFNVSGQKYGGKWTNHFDPESPIFDKRHFAQILLSDLGIGLTVAALTIWGINRSFAEVAKYYLIPYFIVNHHLVMITYLQHTDPMLPHYRKSEWTFAKGAICTVDRSLGGAIGNYVLHGICDTHVAHHVCSKIPHYNGVMATNALKELLGEHYLYNAEPMYKSLWKNFNNCKFVEDTGSCVFYKNKKGVAARTVVYETDSGVGMSDDSSSGEEPDMEVEA